MPLPGRALSAARRALDSRPGGSHHEENGRPALREHAMAHPNEDLVRRAFAAYARGDIGALQGEFFAPDIRWHFPGRSALAGHHEGAAAVVELYGLLGEMSGGRPQVELHDLIGNDDHVVALHTTRAERAGRQLEVSAIQVFHVRDGKITEAWTAHVDQYAADEFWS
jgi:ketosteroid isomerase-like protein